MMIDQIGLFQTTHARMDHRPFEYVERKGKGHPDSICDAVMEQICVSLSEAYLESVGRTLHFNADKALLVAGQCTPRFGGGQIDLPMRLFVGDRVTETFEGKSFPVRDIIEQTIREWFRENMRFVDANEHLSICNEMHPGSNPLSGIYRGLETVASDTSVGVGFAPLSETERLVLEAESFLNSVAFQEEFPEVGEDVKVMAVRSDRELELTVAIAFVDRFISSPDHYTSSKATIAARLKAHLGKQLRRLDRVTVELNTLDDPSAGAQGIYLTVLGTSADGADSGQVGRGNRSNGLISFCRPMSLEAVAGKNPAGHVGKVYNVLADRIAAAVYQSSDAIDEATVWLCSRIGAPLEQPWSASIQLTLAEDASLEELKGRINEIVSEELEMIRGLSHKLRRGEFQVS